MSYAPSSQLITATTVHTKRCCAGLRFQPVHFMLNAWGAQWPVLILNDEKTRQNNDNRYDCRLVGQQRTNPYICKPAA